MSGPHQADRAMDEVLDGLAETNDATPAARTAAERMAKRWAHSSRPGLRLRFDTDDVDRGKVMEAADALLEAGVGLETAVELDDGDAGAELWHLPTRHAAGEGAWIRRVQEENHEWRKRAVPGAGRLDQAGHTAAEAAELLDLYVKAASYEGHVVDREHAKEEAGDVIISLLSLLSMEGWDVVECIRAARGKNDDRDWDEHTGRTDGA